MLSGMEVERGLRDTVRVALSAQGVTVHALARRAGVPRSSLSYWLRAERRLGSSDLCRVLSALGASVTVAV